MENYINRALRFSRLFFFPHLFLLLRQHAFLTIILLWDDGRKKKVYYNDAIFEYVYAYKENIILLFVRVGTPLDIKYYILLAPCSRRTIYGDYFNSTRYSYKRFSRRKRDAGYTSCARTKPRFGGITGKRRKIAMYTTREKNAFRPTTVHNRNNK